MTDCCPYVSFYVERASMHIANQLMDPEFLLSVLEYLDGKTPTPRRLGAFSFIVRRMSGGEMYNINKKPRHFVFNNRGYASTYFSFGGSGKVQAYGPRTGPLLKKLLPDASATIPPSFFSKAVIKEYGASAPFYDIPLPVGLDFEIPKVSRIHHVYVSACVGVRMTHDSTGIITQPRLYEIINYTLDNIEQAPFLGSFLNIFTQIKSNANYWHCDVDTLKNVALCTNDVLLYNSLEAFGDYYRLLSLSMDMFRQVLALPKDTYTLENDADCHEFIFEAISNPKAPSERAKAYNANKVAELSKKEGVSQVIYLEEERKLRKFSPDDLVYEIKDDILYVKSINTVEGYGLSREHNVNKHYPTDKVSLLVESIVRPSMEALCQQEVFDDATEFQEIFFALNKSAEISSSTLSVF